MTAFWSTDPERIVSLHVSPAAPVFVRYQTQETGEAHLRKDAGLKAPSAATRSSMQRQAGSRPVVLIVEDEALLRWTVMATIEEAGFDALEAGNASEAIAILEKRSDVGVVFTDVQMPGSIDGIQLAHLIRTRWPPVKINAASGQLRLRDDDLPPGGRHLQKPYDPSDLIGILNGWMVE